MKCVKRSCDHNSITMKKISILISLLFSLLSVAASAQNSNEGLPDNVRKPEFQRYDIPGYYGLQIPASRGLAAMKYISIFETVTDDLLVYPNPVIGTAYIVLHEPAIRD